VQRQFAGNLGRRQTIVDISAALSKWNDADLEAEQKAIAASLGSLRSEIIATLAVLLLLGAAAATAAWFRIQRIQKCNQEAHEQIAEAREQLKTLSRQLVATQEAERKALSRELHDVIGQSLTALKLELAKAEKIARTEESAATSHLQAIREVADQTLRATKTISLGLRPPMLDDLGLLSALNWLIAEFSRRTGITVDFTADGTVSQLAEDHRTCVYRIVQEALTNCARHSQARCIGLKLDVGEELLALTVTDDGVGFDIGKQKGTGLGLLSMQERAAELGGRFEIDSFVGRGTTIRITIPTVTTAV
jgi:signal transduction histidine kinase